jgi:hypothetical protein
MARFNFKKDKEKQIKPKLNKINIYYRPKLEDLPKREIKYPEDCGEKANG